MVANDWMAQDLADMLAVPVERLAPIETTALGAAMLAGVGCGLFATLEDARAMRGAVERFEPRMDEATRSTRLEGLGGGAEEGRFRLSWCEAQSPPPLAGRGSSVSLAATARYKCEPGVDFFLRPTHRPTLALLHSSLTENTGRMRGRQAAVCAGVYDGGCAARARADHQLRRSRQPSIVATAVQKELAIDKATLGWVLSAFFWVYAPPS